MQKISRRNVYCLNLLTYLHGRWVLKLLKYIFKYLDTLKEILYIKNISDLAADDEGRYTCVAQNQFGLREITAFLSVTGIGNYIY